MCVDACVRVSRRVFVCRGVCLCVEACVCVSRRVFVCRGVCVVAQKGCIL